MAYLVFARKYRPQQFDEVIGQSHITRGLSNAVTSGRLAHAILFSGPRGTGKTTVARILAKCVNCKNGPTATPCNNCPSCREISTSSAADVFEIDGASNNKVENVRELRENAKYMPAGSPYKIFIIDEVHMLSDAAFNALLKTLEEPPGHVLFFFATTEPNKIPVTILSRCQRYDFRRVGIDPIAEHLGNVCSREKIDITPGALATIAREADGSIRDALSLLDQIVTCGTGTITDEQVADMLGVIDRRILFETADALFSADMEGLLGICETLYRQGRHLLRFYAELIGHFRNLIVVKMGGAGKSLAGVPEHERRQMAEQVENVSEPYLNQVLNTLFTDEWRIRQSVSPRHALEMTFFKLLQIRPALSIDTLIEKLDQLRQAFVENAPQSPAAGPATGAPDPAPAQKPAPDANRGSGSLEANAAASQLDNPDLAPGIPAQKETAAGGDETPPAPCSSRGSKEEIWAGLKTHIAEKSPAIGACLGQGVLGELGDDSLEIEIGSGQTNANLLKRKKNIASLEKLCSQYFAKPMKVRLRFRQEPGAVQNSKKEARLLKQEALNHPLVGAAVKTFNGRIVDIRILPTGGNTQ